MKSMSTDGVITLSKPQIQLSKYQQAIVDKALHDTKNNVMINACAGGAKTTTGLYLFTVLQKITKRMVAVAFNKHIQVEFQSRLPEGADRVDKLILSIKP